MIRSVPSRRRPSSSIRSAGRRSTCTPNRALLCAVVMSCALAGAAERASVNVPLVDSPPLLDGRLDDACWVETATTGGFVHPQRGTAAGQPTRFSLVCTTHALYLGARAEEPDLDKLRARCAEHDGPLWGDDCIELFLAPKDNGMEYIQVIVNTLGAVWDAHVTQMGISADASFETGARAVAHLGDSVWTVEVEIPFAGLDLGPDTGSDWGLNVAREKKTESAELSCWAHTGIEKFGVPSKFGLMKLPAQPFGSFAWGLSGFELRNPQFRDDQTADVDFACELRSLGTSPGSVDLAVTLALESGRTVSATRRGRIDAGSAAEMILPVRVHGTVNRVRYTVTDAGTGKVLRIGSEAVDLTCVPVELRLLAPWYRNSIFTSCPTEAIEGEVRLYGKTHDSLRIVLERGGNVRSSTTVRVRDSSGRFRIPATGLPQGDWRLAVLHADGSTAVDETIHVLPPHEGEVCLDREGRLLTDGEPFFPWGFMSAGPDEKLAKAGFNTVHTYIGYYIHRDRDLPAWLNECRDLGLKAIMYCYPGEVGLHLNRHKKRFTEDELRRIAEFVSTYRDHPAILGWYLCDEPRGHVFRTEMKRVRDVVADADPFHPCLVLDNTGRGAGGLAEAGEVVWVDPYPGFAKGGPPRMPLTTVSIAMDEMRRVTGDRLRHFWVAPQAFNWGAWGGPKAETERAPTYTEERSMTYLAIVHGAQGVVYFAWKYAMREPELGNALLDRLGPELRSLMPELLEGVDVDVQAECVDGDGNLHVRALRHGEHIVVFAVNPDGTEAVGRITSAGLGVRTLTVVSEDRVVQVRQGVIRDRFAPYTTHIYVSRQR